jgi:5-methyltetrahydrofolate--homocysteine methyltransferase
MITIQSQIKEKGYLLADGATGTNLFDMGLESGYSPEFWNLEFPERVQANHENFIRAGSDIILTNSFGANKYRLALHDAENKVEELNFEAARLAKESADKFEKFVFIAGSIGPTGEILEPLGALTKKDAQAAFKKQALALKDGGADLLWIETMSSEEEMEAALLGAEDGSLPIICSYSFETHGKTMMGLEPSQIIGLAEKFSSDVIAYGANCGIGAAELIGSLICFKTSKKNEDLLLVAKGNCGVPEFKEDAITYNGTPELMAKYAQLARDMGATIIGGCCGTTHVHIKAMSESLRSYKPFIEKIDLDSIIEELGPMTAGNIEMINNYLNPGSTQIKEKRKRKRKRKRR